MIDKAKLLQWIDNQQYVYSEPYDDVEERIRCHGVQSILKVIINQIERGVFDTDEEEPEPRFNMDAHGNLTLIEE